MGDLLTSTGPLLAAGGLLGIWDSAWPILVMLVGFSFIVFVHELGHFAVAKWAGVRVERFAIGFGREIVGFTRGETRYSFNILPLGGYVKMLGQEDFDDKSNELKFNDDPRSFVNKPVSHRMMVVSAGVVMNILLAFVLFMVVFMAGKEGVATQLGIVVPDDPGDKAGFVPGDDILAVNGKRIREFSEVRMAVLLAPPFEPVDFLIKRADGAEETIHVVPKTSDEMDRLIVGILPGFSREILGLGGEFDPRREDHPHVGDSLVEIDGQPVTDENVNEMYATLAYAHGDVVVERPDPENPAAPPRRVRVEVPRVFAIQQRDRGDEDSSSLLGLTPTVQVASVEPKGRASLGGLEEGDVVLSFDDEPFPTQGQIIRAVRDHAEEDIYFKVRKADGRRQGGFVRPKINAKGPPTIMAHVRGIEGELAETAGAQARIESVRQGGVAHRAGFAAGDIILAAMDVERPSALIVARQIQAGKGKPIRWKVRKPDGREHVAVMVPRPSGVIGAGFAVASDSMTVGRIEPYIGGVASPAAIAGIEVGSEILAVDDSSVESWRAMVDALRARAGGSARLTYRDRRGAQHEVDFPVPRCLRTLLGVGPEARIVSIDGKREVVTETNKVREPVSVANHTGTRAALAELVGRRGVSVEYRENLLAPLKTATIDVTEDMIDPWLGRVALAHRVYLGTRTTIVRGENALDAVGIGIQKTYYFVVQVYETINRMLFSRTVGVENMSGPLGIVAIGGQVARSGLVDFLFFMGIISANLAVINFLPLPIVDGGLMVFLIIEKIKGSPISLKVQVATQMIGLFLILFAFIFVTFNDALKLLG
jgi:membrane-associated protease RseP (regulator of RpoE activity)